jgi:predicted SnoaL-like aldol condensation-catalyzing enzyme
MATEAHRVLTDGEYTATHWLVTDETGAPTAVRFELTRTVDGQVVESYVDDEPWQAETANGNTQIDGPTTIDRTADTDETRRIASNAVQDLLIDGKAETLPEHLAGEDYIQHNPRVANGVSGLVAALTAFAEQGITMTYDGIRQVAADGNFAYLRSEGQFGGQPFVFHDLFRVADGKIIEHWDVMVPATN